MVRILSTQIGSSVTVPEIQANTRENFTKMFSVSAPFSESFTYVENITSASIDYTSNRPDITAFTNGPNSDFIFGLAPNISFQGSIVAEGNIVEAGRIENPDYDAATPAPTPLSFNQGIVTDTYADTALDVGVSVFARVGDRLDGLTLTSNGNPVDIDFSVGILGRQP